MRAGRVDPAPYARNTGGIRQVIINRETRTKLRAGRDSCFDQNRIEHTAARSIPQRDTIVNQICAGEWKIAEIHCHLRHRRTTRPHNVIENAPVAEQFRPPKANEVALRYLRGKSRLIYDEDLQTFSGQ